MWNVICLAGMLLAATTASAIDFINVEQFVRGEKETLTEETWLSAQTVTFNGVASNDLFAAGVTRVELNGTFYGDVWSGSDQFQSAGIFRDSLRVIARSAQVSGTLYGPLLTMGNTVEIERDAVLYHDAVCIGENVIINGSVGGDLRILAQRATLGGQITGDVLVAAQDLVVLPDTIIHGNLTYTAPKELVLSSTVQLDGELKRQFSPAPVKTFLKPNLLGHFLFCMAALVAGLAFCGLFPAFAGGACRALTEARGLCILTGFAALVLLPMASILLLFTVIAMPLSVLTLLFYSVLLYLARIVVALSLGTAILRSRQLTKQTVAAPLALGLIIIYALTSVSAASLIINVLVTVIGLGALLVALFRKPVLVIQKPGEFNEPNKEN